MLSKPVSIALLFVMTAFLLSGCGGGGGGNNNNSADRTPPVITLVGPAAMDHEQGTAFTDPGATATDAVDGTVPVTVSGSVGVDAGSYTLTYTASDRAGNVATTTRTVTVADTTAPVITLVGSASMTHLLGTPFTDPGVSATDTASSALSASPQTSNPAPVRAAVLRKSRLERLGSLILVSPLPSMISRTGGGHEGRGTD